VAVPLGNGSSAQAGGGIGGRYKVNSRGNGRFFDVESGTSKSYERIPLVVCEDLCFYPEKYIVTLDQALAAMRHFCATGELSPEFSWNSGPDYDPFELETRAEAEPGAAPGRAHRLFRSQAPSAAAAGELRRSGGASRRIDRTVESGLHVIMPQAKILLRRRNPRLADDHPPPASPWSKETCRSGFLR
jgi:hypothetical protein